MTGAKKRELSLLSSLSMAGLAYLAADAAGMLEPAILCFMPVRFFAALALVAFLAFLTTGFAVVSAGAAAAVGAVPAALGAAGAWANETAATLESKAAAIRVLIFTMIETHS